RTTRIGTEPTLPSVSWHVARKGGKPAARRTVQPKAWRQRSERPAEPGPRRCRAGGLRAAALATSSARPERGAARDARATRRTAAGDSEAGRPPVPRSLPRGALRP